MYFTRKKRLLCYLFPFLFFLFNCGNEKISEDTSTSEERNPKITAIAPTEGSPGTKVTITGTGFSSLVSEVTVRFNSVSTAEITFASATQISATVPNGASTGAIILQIGTKEVIGPDFVIQETPISPSISSLNKNEGIEGSLLSILGSNFGDDPARITVSFNGRVATETTLTSSSEITTRIPIGAISGPVILTVNEETIAGPEFNVHPPQNYKIAFLGDSNIGPNAQAVLNLVKNENANAVIHPGDLNYAEIPTDFEAHINSILGADFPYFFGVGNHDDTVWNGASGYQQFLENRFSRLGIPWNGQAGVQSSFTYQGIFFVSSAPDEFGISPTQASNHVKEALAATNALWRVSYWHKNQRLMQIGGKSDEAGWGVYDESRKGGALMATGHEHSYSRTYEMSNFQVQAVSSTDNTIQLIKDDLNTVNTDEGRSFAFVSGLGGRGIRDAESNLDRNPWWANVYSSSNGGQYGALFGEFNYNGDITLARFYYKDIDGATRDIFFVRSNN